MRRDRSRGRPAIGPLLACSAVILFLGAPPAFRIAVNASPSLPVGLYRLDSPAAERGDLVLLCLPPRLAGLARSRGYLGPGICPGKIAPLGKIVIARAGDRVEVGQRGIVVNRRRLPNSRARVRDGRGRPLAGYPAGSYRVARGEIWVLSPFHPLAWDSRYFGPLPKSAVRARIAPLLVRGASAAPPGFRLRWLEPRVH